MQRATEEVEALYAFRDRYFEQHGLHEAGLKGSRVESRRTEALRLLAELEAECGDRAGFLALRGRALNVVPDYVAEAEEALARAVKLRPALVHAWNELGDVYWKKGDVAAATSCLEGALAHCRNKVSLRSLSMLLRQQPSSEQRRRQDPARLIMDSVAHAKDAVAMDTGDGTSWYILGNAYFSLFFVTAQDPRILQLSLNAYAQAEKVDTTAGSNADLHLNRATLLQYRELFAEALDGFARASALEPTWTEPAQRRSELLHFLRRLSALVASKGKVKAKKLQAFMKGLRDADLGPYAAGGGPQPTAGSGGGGGGGAEGPEGPRGRAAAAPAPLSPRSLAELSEGANAGAVLLGRVLFSVTTEHSLPFVFGLLDSQGSCCAVSVYNFVSGWGVLIGDSVAVPSPSLRTHHVHDGQEVLAFPCVRVSSPASLVVNGRQQGSSKQAAVTASYSRKFT
uniref:Tetratricopeptide repeat protein 5 isoform X1 n=1 Tax=Petromyzon marinus TaxID=7757 RepID=A0AAJ7UHH6_PETMA|nr:tetratricopeptide repeat protein 5 isoform X1 [Petromyzon marinus]XP_032834904.1 tetratricopeptide repeat protein 5 isoform X2 [Petromyzon marinus]